MSRRRPRTIRAIGAGLALSLVTAGAAAVVPGVMANEPDARPNVVFVMTDDLSTDVITYMGEVQKMIDEGITFSNFITSNALCCPARASVLTGKYPHNTEVTSNKWPEGGFGKFFENDLNETVGVYLDGAGYRTGLMGKFMNGYHPLGESGSGGPPDYGEAFVPPGWDRVWMNSAGYQHFKYRMTVGSSTEARLRAFFGDDESNYLTDRLAREARQFILNSETDPFFLTLTPYAVHGSTAQDPEKHGPRYPPAPRDRPRSKYRPANWDPPEFPRNGDCGGEARGYASGGCNKLEWPPTPENFNKIVENPVYWAPEDPLSSKQVKKYEKRYVDRIRMAQAVDDLIKTVRKALEDRGVADNTYLIFGSDNGYHMGEHAMKGKATAYDHDVNLPFIVVPPGKTEPRVVDAVVSNVDLLPTFADIAGVTDFAEPVDGASFLPFINNEAIEWRDAALVESMGGAERRDPDWESRRDGSVPPFAALRGETYSYIDYTEVDGVLPPIGFAEYFDLEADPYQTVNLFPFLTTEERRELNQALLAYVDCDGSACWSAGQSAP